MIYVSKAQKAICFPPTPAIRTLFQNMHLLDGTGLGVLPHTEEITSFLRSEGVAAPSPIASHYDWEGGNPYDVQVKTADLLTMNRRAYVLNSMGTGKSKAALWAWRYLNRANKAKKLLVVAPLSTLKFVWAREVFETLPGVKCSVVWAATRDKRMRLLAADADIYVTNHHGLKLIEPELLKRDDIDTVVFDELAVYRHGNTGLTKCARAVAYKMKWVWGLTGSPTPNGPEDAWGQATVVNPKAAPPFFKRWRDEVMLKVNDFRWVPKSDAQQKVHALMQPAVRYSLDDVVELPELVVRPQEVDMGPDQNRIYLEMEKAALAEVGTGTVDALNSGAVLSKLLQISCGFVYMRDGSVVKLDGDARLEACVDIIMSASNKTIVFAPYKHVLKGIMDKLNDEKIDVAQVSGDTPKGQRDKIFSAFQTTDQYQVLAAHPQCMAHGLTLTRADTIVWFGPVLSFEIFDQANARIRRIGQKHKQQIIMLQGTKVEKKQYKNLMSKDHNQNVLLDMFAESTGQILTA